MERAVDGVILAAGLSSRMQRPKPLLEVGTETFAERALNTLQAAGCRRVYLVANAGAEWTAGFAGRDGVDVVVNEQVESEQVDSLRLVLQRVPADTAAVLVLPVDLPLVTVDTVRLLLDAYRLDPAPLYLPFHNTVAGHPVLLDRSLFAEVLDGYLDEGVRTLIMNHARDLREVKVADPGILIDIDTPDDYWRYIETR